MIKILIDSDGEVWDGGSRQLRTAFDSPYSGGEFSTYAIRNLGFVGVCIYGRSCQLVLGTNPLSQETAVGVHNWLRRQKYERYIVSGVNGEEVLKLISSPSEILQYTLNIAEQSSSITNKRYYKKTVNQRINSSLIKLLDLLSSRAINLSNEVDLHVLQQHAAEAFGGRHIVATVRPDSEYLTFGQIGDDLFKSYGSWRNQAIGAPVDDLPDAQYGSWVQDSYKDAILHGTSKHEEIDAIVRWPHVGKARLRYERTILPFVDAKGLPALISGTSVNNSIDLRLETV